MLEKEFMSTAAYVKIDADNYLTFSDAYAKLLLQIGSEIDVVAKETCKLINPSFNGNEMKDYRAVLSVDTDFCNTRIQLINYGIILDPWKDLETTITTTPNALPAIIWWKAYNKVKHERMNTVTIDGDTKESYKFANLKNVLNALGALYHLLLHSFYLILKSEGKAVEAPLPGSRLYKMAGTVWNNVTFSFDTSFSIDNNTGCLMLKTSTIPY